MKEADYTGAFLVIGGHVLVPIFALVIISIMVRSIKRYGGDPYEEMPWAGLFMLSLLVGLVISPIWIYMCLFLSAFLSAAGSADAWRFTVIASFITMLIYIIIIVFCAVGNDRKNKIIRRNNKN